MKSHFRAKQHQYRSRSGFSVHVQAGLSELHLLVNSGKKHPFCVRGKGVTGQLVGQKGAQWARGDGMKLTSHSASLLCLSSFVFQASSDMEDCAATRLAPSMVVRKTNELVNWTMMTEDV